MCFRNFFLCIALDDHLTAGAWDACGWTLALFVICNSWSRQDASYPEKCFINSQIETFHPQHPLHDSQMNKVHFPLFFCVVLEEFGTVNSPLCTAAPPKAKEKHKACNFQDRLGQKPLELRRISSASKCRSSPSFGEIKSRLTCKSQAKNLCNWPPLTTSKAYSISDIHSPSCWIYETFLGITWVDIRSPSCRIYEIVSSDSEK